jgi:hypothetical protein
LFSTAEAARNVARGTISLRVCEDCGFVFNAEFDPSLLDYGDHYDNTQSYSPAFKQHVDGLVDELVQRQGVRGRRIVEVGCGKGEFLKRLVLWPDSANRGMGFDPSYAGPETDLGGRLKFQRTFYQPRETEFTAEVVVCRHVIEHVLDPIELLKSVRTGVVNLPTTQVFFETPCVEWILRHRVFWDFFYEHCSLFSAVSLATAFQLAGFSVESVRHVFSGQYLWLQARPAVGTKTPQRNSHVSNVSDRAMALGWRERQTVAQWRSELTSQNAKGRVAVWGAGAKGVTFCNLADPDAHLIDCVVDMNPAKQGRFVAGTGHPIVAPQQLVERDVKRVLVLNPNYVVEIRAHVASLSQNVVVVDLMANGKVLS